MIELARIVLETIGIIAGLWLLIPAWSIVKEKEREKTEDGK